MGLKERAQRIRMVLMDVDGVLTDGRLYYTEHGERVKVFSVHDGLGIRLLQRAGIATGVISGRESPALERRLKELGIDEIFMGRSEKGEVLRTLVERKGISPDEIAFIGDDLVDIPVLSVVGFPVTVSSAPPEVRRVCVYTTMSEGGRGALRELAELILRLRGLYGKLMEKYTG